MPYYPPPSAGGVAASITGNTDGTPALISSGTLYLAGGTNVTLSQNGQTVSVVGATAAGDGGVFAAASGSTVTAGTVVWSNSNNVSFGMNGSTITATATHPAQTLQTQMTGLTAGMSSDGNTLGTTGLVSNRLQFYGGNNITLSQSVNAQSATLSIHGVAAQTVQTQNFVALVGSGANGVGTFSSGSVSLKVGANVTLSTGANVISIYGEAAAPAQTVQTQNMVAAIVSGANGNGTFSSGTMSVKAGNNITLSTGANVFSIHGEAAQTVQTQNMIAVIGSGANGNGTYSSGTLSLKAGNNITISTGANVLSLHGVAAQTTQTQDFCAVIVSGANGNGTFTSGTLSIKAGNNVTLSTGANVFSIHAPAAGAGGGIGNEVRGANGTATFTSGTITIAAGNNITLSTGVDAFSIHGVAAQTTQTQNMVVLVGAGANGTGTFSSGTVSLVAGSNITLSTAANVISVHGPAAQTLSGYHPYDEGVPAAGQVGQGTLHIQPLQIPVMQYDRVAFSINWTNATNSSGSATVSQWIGLYTKNVSTLSLDISTSTSVGITFAGTGGNQSLQAGPRILTIPWTQTLTKGNYWVGVLSRTASGNTDGSFSQFLLSDIASAHSGVFGVSSATSVQRRLGLGHYSATTNSLPAAVTFSQILGTNASAGRQPIFFFASGTA